MIGIVQANELGDCLLIDIVLANDFTGCPLIGIAWAIDFGLFTWIGLVGATASRNRPLIGIVRTIGFGSDLLIGIVMTIEYQRAVLFESRQLLVELHNISCYYCLYNWIGNSPVYAIMCKVLYCALSRVISIHWGVYYHNIINRYTPMTFIEQLTSRAASELICAHNSNHFPIAEVPLDNST